jgi:hypothetical protein
MEEEVQMGKATAILNKLVRTRIFLVGADLVDPTTEEGSALMSGLTYLGIKVVGASSSLARLSKDVEHLPEGDKLVDMVIIGSQIYRCPQQGGQGLTPQTTPGEVMSAVRAAFGNKPVLAASIDESRNIQLTTECSMNNADAYLPYDGTEDVTPMFRAKILPDIIALRLGLDETVGEAA